MAQKLLSPEEKDQVGGAFLSGIDFEQGLVLEIVSMKSVKADNEKFGAKEDGNGLKKGEVWAYTFKTELGTEKVFKNGSSRLAGAISRLDPETGTKLRITRSGEGTDTAWSVELA